MIKDIFSKVLCDNFSGSGQILRSVQQSLLQLAQAEENPDLKALLVQLEKLEHHFPHFALLFHFLNELKMFVVNNPETKGRQLEEFVRQYQLRWENAQQQASENLLKNLSFSGKNILLHSNSSALHNLFETMAARKIFPVVWQTVSSPANEGIVQAEFLKGIGFDIHLFHEDAVSKFISNIDFAVFGADLLWDDSFMNKSGTFPLALLFSHFYKPVYVLAESRKKIHISEIGGERLRDFLDEQPKPAEEITEKSGSGLHVHNEYFEVVPLSLVNQVFMEK